MKRIANQPKETFYRFGDVAACCDQQDVANTTIGIKDLSKSLLRTTLISFFVFALVMFNHTEAYSQCAASTNFNSNPSAPPCGEFALINIGPGEYANVPVVNGANYTITLAASAFDPRLTLHNGATYITQGAAIGNESVDWTATFTGVLKVSVAQQSCGGFNGLSATLSLRQNAATLTGSTAAVCQGQSVALSANFGGSATADAVWSGTGVTDGTGNAGTFVAPTPPAGSVNYTQFYNQAECQSAQSITVYANPTPANAGSDQAICGTNTIAEANSPIFGLAQWSCISGCSGVGITTTDNPNASVSGLAPGAHTLRWTVSNGVCNASSDDVVITATAYPLNDGCAGASAPILSAGTHSWSNICATGSDITSCGFNDYTDIWYRYTPPCSGIAEFNLCGTTPGTFDVTIALFTGCGTGEVTGGCNDDNCGLQSRITPAVTGGVTYYIRIAGRNGQTGSGGVLTIIDPTTPGPLTFTAGETLVCPGSSGIFYQVTASAATGYIWAASPGVVLTGSGNSRTAGFPLTPNGGFYNISVTPTNDCGSGAVVFRTVQAIDNTPPDIFGCPANINTTTSANGTGDCSTSVTWTPPEAEDNCFITSYVISHNPGDIFSTGVTAVTYTATDQSGNSSVCTFNVTVTDNELPLISCPASFSVNTSNNGLGDCTAQVSWTAPVGTDNCPGYSTVQFSGVSSGSAQTVGVYNIVYRVTAANSATASCNFNVTVVDNEVPIVNCKNITVNLSALGAASINTSSVHLSSSDNCLTVNLVSVTPSSFGCSNVGANTVTLNVNDGKGNVNSCTATVTISDVTPPSVSCKANNTVIVQLNVSPKTITVADIKNTSSDACGIATEVISPTSFTCNLIGNRTVTLTVTDVNGRTATCTTIVSVRDQIPPVAVCQDVTVYLDGSGQGEAFSEDFDGGSTDACGLGDILFADNFDFFYPVSCADIPFVNVEIVVADSRGNESSCFANIYVVDNIPPSPVCIPYTAQLNAAGTVTISGSNINGGSTDNCGITNLAASPSTFTCANVGANNVTLTVTGTGGTTATCATTVTVQDNVNPNAVCQNVTVVLNSSGSGSTTAAAVNNGSSDACGIASLSLSTTSFSCSNVGANSVTLTVTDNNGKVGLCTATVTVQDNTPPTTICQNVTVQLDALGNASVTAAQVNNGSSDACGIASLSVSPNSFVCANLGANTITLTVTDVNTNSATCTATVTVEDNTNPTVSCPANVSQFNDLDSCNAYVTIGAPVAQDNCSATLTVTNSYTGSSNASGRYPVGTTNVVWTITDAGTNTVTCTQTVTITDNEKPTLTCPADILQVNDPADCGHTFTDPIVVTTYEDNCGVASVLNNKNGTSDAGSGTSYNNGLTVVKWTITDIHGNTATCNQIIVIVDIEPPVVTCPPNITVNQDPTKCTALIDIAATPPTATDNCQPPYTVTIGNNHPSATYAVGTTVVVWTAVDGIGNTDTCHQTIVVNDVTPPNTVCKNITVQLDATGNTSIVAADVNNGSSDECGIASYSVSSTAFTCANVGGNTVTLTVTDVNTNSATCTATVTVEDNVNPIAICQNVTVQLNASGNGSVTSAQVDNGSNDACGIASLSVSPSAFVCSNVGSGNLVTLTVTDNNSNTKTCTTVITVEDNVAPVAVCQNITTQLDASGNSSILETQVDNGSSDACGLFSVTVSPNTFTCSNVGSNTVILTVTDNNTNVSTCTATVMVEDNIIPVAICKNITIQLSVGTNNGDGAVSIVADDIDNGSNDACGIASLSASQTDFTCAHLGGNSITLTVTDVNTNTSTCVSTVTVEDNVAPIITCPANITQPADAGTCTAVVNVPSPTSNDNCAVVAEKNNYNSTSDASDVYNLLTTTVIWTATDQSGNTITCSMTITVTDNQNPTIICAADIVQSADAGLCTANVSVPEPARADNCKIVSIVHGLTDATTGSGGANASGIYNLGTTTITYTVTDTAANTATCSMTVTIRDEEFPVITCPASIVQTADVGVCDAAVTIPEPVRSDNCSIVTITNSYNSNGADASDTYPIGITSVEWVVTDTGGNQSSCSITVQITDNENPTIACPTDYNQTADAGECEAGVVIADPIVGDNCPAVQLTVINDYNPFTNASDDYPVGTTTVKYTVTDTSDNVATCTFDVTITDDENPIVNCPLDIVVSNDVGYCGAIVEYTVPIGTDNCPGAVTIQTAGLGNNQFYPVGTTTEAYQVTDAHSHTATCSFTVTVVDEEAPTLTCPEFTQTADPGVCEAAVVIPAIGASDNCVIASIVNDYNNTSDASDTYPVGSTNVTWTVTDTAAIPNVATCIQVVTITDDEAPEITCPYDPFGGIFVLADASACGTFVNVPPVQYTNDNCAVALITNDITGTDDASAFYPVGLNEIVWTVTDQTGNTASCTDMIFVVDNKLPTALCQNLTIQLDSTGNAYITPDDVDAGSWDNCGISIKTLSKDHFTCANLSATTTVTLTVVDPSGNQKKCNSIITVNDTIAPVAICEDVTIQLSAGTNSGDGLATLTESQVDDGSTDNCTVVSRVLDRTMFFCSEINSINVVTLTVTDQSGNSSTCTAIITVEDNINPVMVCNDITVQLDASGFVSITPYDVASGSDDNCNVITGFTAAHTFGCGQVGVTVVTVIGTDQSGNSATCNSNVTVEDNVDPVANCLNITVQLSPAGAVSITGSDVNDGSSDACGIDSLNVSPSNFGCANVGANTVILTVTDKNGNTSTCTAVVTAEDNVQPVAQCDDITIQLNAAGNAVITANDVDNGSNDACGVTLSANPTSFGCANVGSNTVTLTVTDPSGNTKTCLSTVTVEDNVDPIAECKDVTIQLNAGGSATITANDIDNGSNDACGIASLVASKTSFNCSNVGGNTVVLSVTDNNGNLSTCSATVTVEDNVNPVALCQDITVQLNALGVVSITGADVNNGSSDACGIASLVASPNSFGCANVGANIVTLTVTDNNTNSSTCTSTVTVEDNVAPVAICKNIIVQLDASGNASITASSVDNGSNDACGVSLSVTPASFACANVGANTVTLTVTDVNTNASTCTATVTIQDNVAPVALCQNITVQLNAAGAVSITPGNVDDGSNDACGIASLSVAANSFTCANVGGNTVTLTVTDVNTNVSTCTAIVTVEDNVNPVAICQNVTVQLNAAGTGSITAANVNDGSNDACGIASLVVSPNSFACANVGANTVILTVTDNNTNTSTCTATVTVEDKVAPEALCQNITVQLNAGGTVSITFGDVNNGSNDACGIASLSVVPNGFNCSNVGGNTVELTVTDNNANVSTCTATVTVEDNVNPVALCQNITIQLNAAGATSITAGNVDNGSNDACGIASLSVSPNSFTCSNVGGNTVTLTVTDNNTNVSMCTSTVTVEDNVNPVALCQNITIQLNGSGSASIVANDIDNGSNDACGIASLVASKTSFDCSNVGNNNVVLTVTDNNSNTATCLAIVKVEDNVLPTITCAPDQSHNNDGGLCSAAITVVSPAFVDNCASSIVNNRTSTSNASGVYPVGITTLLWTVTDANGNTATCTQVITILDTENPNVTCPANQIQSADAGVCDADVAIAIPLHGDNCVVASLTNTYNGTSNASDNYPVGVTSVTYTVTDTSGNSTTCSFTVDINDEEVPSITCAPDQNHVAEPGVCEATVSVAGPTVGDNCAAAGLTLINDYNGTSNAGDTYPVGINQVTWTVTDTAGNFSICVQLVNVFDNEDPTITCPANIVQNSDPGQCNANVTVPAPVTDDNCGVAGLTNGYNGSSNASDNYPVGTTGVVFTVFDSSGNHSTCAFTVKVEDHENPVITCVDQNQTADPDVCQAAVTVPTPVTSDNCAVAGINNTYNSSNNASDIYLVGITTFTWTVTDIYGNTSSCNQTITITDNEAPTNVCAPAQTQTADAGVCQAAVTVVGPTTGDNCGVDVITNDYNNTSNASDTYLTGITVVTWTATDTSGNSTTCTQVITVTDNEAPTNVCAPAQTQTADAGVCQAAVTVVGPTTGDNCGVDVITNDYNNTSDASDTYLVGITVVTWTATDTSGNSTTCTQVITVTDDEAPTNVCAPAQTQTADAGVCQAAVTVVGPTTGDNCGVDVITNDYNNTSDASDTYLVGITVVTWTATDTSGNSTTCTQVITVTDNEAPTNVCAPAQTQTADAGVCQAAVTVVGPTTGDNCGVSSVTNNYNGTSNASDTYLVGITVVTWTASDTSGNSTTCTQTITVTDNQNPIISGCPANIVQIADSNDCNPIVNWTAPTANDNCGVSTFTSNYNPGDRFDVDPGFYTVVYTVGDTSGNSSTCTFTITINSRPLVATVSSPTRACGYNISCNGASDGSIDLHVSGGCLAYTYSWTGPGGFTASTEDISGLVAGTYNVTITDGRVINQKTTTASITLTQPVVLANSGVKSVYACGYNISCNGAADGSINLTVTGGCPPYTYEWDKTPFSPVAPGFNPSSEDQSGLIVGLYRVLVTDANGCETFGSFTITQPAALTSSLSGVTYPGGNNFSCNNACDGGINLTVAGGASCLPYTYSWVGPDSSYQRIDSKIVYDTTYNVITIAGNADQVYAQTSITNTTNALGVPNGSGAVFDNTNDMLVLRLAHPLPVGSTYKIRWKRTSGSSASLKLYESTDGNIFGSSRSYSTSSSSYVDLTVTVVLNNTRYIKLLSTSSTDFDVDAVSYSVNGSSMVITPRTVFYPVFDTIVVYDTTYNVVTTSGNAVSVTSQTSITNPTYALGTPGGAGALLDNTGDILVVKLGHLLPVGTTYNVTWRQAPGTSGTSSLKISESTNNSSYTLKGTFTTTNESYFNTSLTTSIQTQYLKFENTATPDLEIDAVSYSFNSTIMIITPDSTITPIMLVSHFNTTAEDLSNLCRPGTYHVTVTDANGCVKVDSITLVAPAPLQANLCGDQQAVLGYYPENVVLITSVATGGVGPYTYLWSTGETTASIEVAPTATTTYSLSITDINGCGEITDHLVAVADIRCGSALDRVEVCKNNKTYCIKPQDVPAYLCDGYSFGACTGSGGGSGYLNVLCSNGLDDDHDGLIDCADPGCNAASVCNGGGSSNLTLLDLEGGTCGNPELTGCGCDGGIIHMTLEFSSTITYTVSGNATQVAASNSVSNSSYALGAPDGSGAIFDASADWFTLNLNNTIPAGKTYTIKWRKVNNTPAFNLYESADGVSFTLHPGSPFGTSNTSYYDLNVVANIGTKYLRFNNTDNDDFNIDAVSYNFQVTDVLPGGVNVSAYAGAGHTNLIASFSNVQDGDHLTIDGSGLVGCAFGSKIYLYVDGYPDIQVSTACSGGGDSNSSSGSSSSSHGSAGSSSEGGGTSGPVIGSTYGNFTLVSWTDVLGATCDDNAPDCPICHPSGQLKLMTLIYRGPNGATVRAFDAPQGNVFQTWANVNQGDSLFVNGTLQNGAKFDYLTAFEVVGSSAPRAVIPTDCENGHGADIIGRIYGDFMVTGLVDKKDNACGMEAPCPCNGGVWVLGIIYDGPAGGTVKAYYKSGHQDLLGTFTNLNQGDTIIINSHTINKTNLGSYTYFQLVGSSRPDLMIPTDCGVYTLYQSFDNASSSGGMGQLEVLCSNGIDDDHDGLTDCADPGCAAAQVCSGGSPALGLTVIGFIDKERVECNMQAPPRCPCEGGLAQITIEFDQYDSLLVTDTTLLFFGDAAHLDTIAVRTSVSSGDVLTISAINVVTTSGNAASVTSQTSVGSASNSLGAPNNSGALMDNTGDVLVVQLGHLLPAGTTYNVTWRQKPGFSGTSSLKVSESTNNSSYTLKGTLNTTNESYFNSSFTASIPTKYLKFEDMASPDLEIDAVSYSWNDTTMFGSGVLPAITYIQLVGMVRPDIKLPTSCTGAADDLLGTTVEQIMILAYVDANGNSCDDECGLGRTLMCHDPSASTTHNHPAHTHCVKNSDVAWRLQHGHGTWSLGPCATAKMSEAGIEESTLGFSLTAYPNPFSDATTISFRLSKTEKVTLKVYNLAGEEVTKLFESEAEEGQRYELQFKADSNSDGMYFYRLVTESGEVHVRKLILTK